MIPRDDLIRMAREAGMDVNDKASEWGAIITAEPADLERFATLVAAAEREACAELMERQHTWVTNVAAANLIRARGTA